MISTRRPRRPATRHSTPRCRSGARYSDPDRGIYITARSETATTATVEIQRDPIDPSPPVIIAVTVILDGRAHKYAVTVTPH